MSEETIEYDENRLKQMNDKAIENQFFTPDCSYIELNLMKDIPLGCIFADYIIKKNDKVGFESFQKLLGEIIKEYQTRVYDTIDPYFSNVGYTDEAINNILSDTSFHDYIFMMAPMTKFFNFLIKHTIRNQNHSKPANKYTKKKIDKDRYILEPVQVTYRINTYPLRPSDELLKKVAIELGESFGVNIAFMCKDSSLFDETDWNDWMEKVDCFYIDSIGRFSRSPFFIKKQGEFQFSGAYFFVRKRFERHVRKLITDAEFESEIQIASAHMGLFCEFMWLQNNDTRLTEESEDVPMNDDQVIPDNIN